MFDIILDEVLENFRIDNFLVVEGEAFNAGTIEGIRKDARIPVIIPDVLNVNVKVQPAAPSDHIAREKIQKEDTSA